MAEAGVRVGTRAGGWRAEGLAAGGMLAVLAGTFALVLARSGGTFTYVLDDAYIHLALAEELARGHHGVSPGEVSSPSSSPLWPLLLVPLARTALGVWTPLVLAAACALAAAAALARVVREAVGEGPRTTVAAGAAGFALALLANVPALVFTGLEHTAQVFVAVLVAAGLAREAAGRGAPRWLGLALVLGPLVRYEMLALTTPALVYLWARGHRRLALGAGAATVGLLGAFSLFLLSLGLPVLPTSVLAKLAAPPGGGTELDPVLNALRNLKPARGRLLALAALALAGVALVPRSTRPPAERGLGAWGAAAVALHLLAGRMGWFDRYEAYAWATAGVVLVALFRVPLGRFVGTWPAPRAALLGAALVVALGPDAIENLARTPAASEDVRLQPCEMHRFAVRFWRAPVAVNDLGCVAFRNDRYVLDLWGLASDEALHARRTGVPADWMDALADARDVRLAMLYPGVFDVPPAWIPLGDLHLGRPSVIVYDETVRFYARDAGAAARARPLLEAWARGLPGSATFTPAPAVP